MENNQMVTACGYNYDTKLASLTQDQRTAYLALADKISIDDASSIRQYGSDLNTLVTQESNGLLSVAKMSNQAEVVQIASELMSRLDLIDLNEIQATWWKSAIRKIPVINKFVMSAQQLIDKYKPVEEEVRKIADKFGTVKIVAMRDNSIVQQMYDNNKTYIEKMAEYIIGAKLKDEEIGREIERMRSTPEKYQTYEIQDANDFRHALQRRIASMETNQYVLLQNRAQMNVILKNNDAIMEKAEEIITNTIPIWMVQLTMAIIINNQKSSLEAEQLITEYTNTALQKNSERLKINAISVAKASEQGIISMETLQKTTKDLVDTITEVKRIHEASDNTYHSVENNIANYCKQLESAAFGTVSARISA